MHCPDRVAWSHPRWACLKRHPEAQPEWTSGVSAVRDPRSGPAWCGSNPAESDLRPREPDATREMLHFILGCLRSEQRDNPAKSRSTVETYGESDLPQSNASREADRFNGPLALWCKPYGIHSRFRREVMHRSFHRPCPPHGTVRCGDKRVRCGGRSGLIGGSRHPFPVMR